MQSLKHTIIMLYFTLMNWIYSYLHLDEWMKQMFIFFYFIFQYFQLPGP